MKNKFILTVIVLLTATNFASAAINDVATLVERGLFEEEANHQLEAAIADYKEAIAHFDRERKLAATAIFRLGECYRKQGRTNEANAQYERIVREFPDQTPLAQLSGAYLPASATPGIAAGAPALPSDEAEYLRKAIESLQTSPDLINQQLDYAVRNSYVSAVEFLLAHGADVKQGSLLDVAARQGNEAMVRLLLAHGADVNHNRSGRDSSGDTPLSLAVGEGFKGVCLTLISNGADVNLQSPIVTAARQGNEAMVELLLNHGAAVNHPDGGGNTALSVAVAKGFMPLCQALVARGADVNTKDKDGTTPLLYAVAVGKPAAAGFLITNKAPIDATNNNGDTALLIALRLVNKDMVKLLLDHGADVNVANNGAETPLALAIARGQSDLVQMLLDHGADANKEAVAEGWSDRLTPLFWAIQFERPEIVKLLLEHKADPNAVRSSDSISAQASYAISHSFAGYHFPFGPPSIFGTGDTQATPWRVFPPVPGETPLMLAVLEPNRKETPPGMPRPFNYQRAAVPGSGAVVGNGAEPHQPELAQLLLEQGAKPNIADPDGWTALVYAIGVDNSDAVRLLIAHGADVNALDKKGLPPLAHLSLSRTETGPQIEELLVKAGADRDYNRRRALWICGVGGTPKIELFECPTNSINHYTLLESVAELYRVPTGGYGVLNGFRGHYTFGRYAEGGNIIPFPYFDRVAIQRRDGTRGETLHVNVAEIFQTGDCSKDVPLQPGDMVEIAKHEHKVADKWPGLTDQQLAVLNKCLLRTVQVIAQGHTNDIALAPCIAGQHQDINPYPDELPVDILDVHRGWLADALKGRKADIVVRSFLLDKVLRNENVLLNTWDLSRVTLVRAGAKLTFDLTAKPAPEVWLEDGDVIEIPDIGENVSAAGETK